jgi:hypothetical protein
MMRQQPMGNGFPPAVRAIILERSGGVCEYCGLQRGTDAHHRRPRGLGGSRRKDTNTASNALWLCGACHRWAESHRTDALHEGILCLQIESPRKSAVRYRGRYVFLDDLGNVLEEAA